MKLAVSQILDNGRLVPIRANASQGLVAFNNGGDWSLSTNGTTITPSHTTVNVGAEIDGTEHYALIASGLGPSAAAAGTPSVPERLRALAPRCWPSSTKSVGASEPSTPRASR
ncbi:MAG TPA: hypothetical protein VF772_12205 [Terriglobales bacterium]